MCINSFILDIHIAPLQETCSEELSVQLWAKRNDLRSLQKDYLYSSHHIGIKSFVNG